MGTKKQVKHLSFLSLLSVAVLSQLSVDDGSLSFTTKTVKAEDTLTATTPLVTAPETTTVSETNKTVEPTVTSRVLETPKATFSVAAPQPSTELSTPVALAATAEEPPADEDVPDLNEQNLINQVNQQLDDIQLFLDEGDVAYAKQLFDDAAADFAAVNNIVNMKASKATLLEKIEKYRALVNGGSTTPVTVTKTEVIAVTKVYEADPSLAYGQQTTKIGTAGEQSYTETNGVRDAGSEKLITAMVPTVIKVGTMPKEEVVVIPAPTTVVYEDDPTLEIGQTKLKTAAVAGSKTVVTSYQLKDATSAEVITTSSEKDIVAGQEAVYLRGTKQPDVVPVTVTKTEAIAVTTVYEADPSLAYGQQITQTGTAGEQSYTETNGVRDVGSEKLITAMVPTVVKVGTMPKEEVVAIPAPTTVVYEDDPTLEIGQTKLKTAAVAGSKTVVTSYQLKDATSAEVITTTSEKDIVAGREAVYLRGTKQPDVVTVVSEEIVTEAIDYSSIVVENPNLEKGKENQLQAGKPGVMKRVYTVITVNGVEISRELISEEVLEEASSEIIEVGTMEKPSPSNTPKDTPLSNQSQLDASKPKQEVKQTMGKGELPQTGDSQGLLELSGLMLLGMLTTVAKVFKKRF
ncbi:cell wall protein [Streptococcus iniae]|uniref:G5 domain-containing protein n=1 Tax=Streptococcus iniae TaxID=1346 RepID=UPI000EF709E7|nr:G5 domain-containing protein [Streptococcus iniae]RLV27005.1 cell wall protein [Streptococcus iniae]